jgi:hypothetical protein
MFRISIVLGDFDGRVLTFLAYVALLTQSELFLDGARNTVPDVCGTEAGLGRGEGFEVDVEKVADAGRDASWVWGEMGEEVAEGLGDFILEGGLLLGDLFLVAE